MPYRLVPPIILLGVDPVELSHASREVSLRGLDHQVIVGIHEAISVTKPIEPLDHGMEDVQKQLSIGIVFEYFISRIAPRGNMVEATRKFDSQGT